MHMNMYILDFETLSPFFITTQGKKWDKLKLYKSNITWITELRQFCANALEHQTSRQICLRSKVEGQLGMVAMATLYHMG